MDRNLDSSFYLQRLRRVSPHQAQIVIFIFPNDRTPKGIFRSGLYSRGRILACLMMIGQVDRRGSVYIRVTAFLMAINLVRTRDDAGDHRQNEQHDHRRKNCGSLQAEARNYTDRCRRPDVCSCG